MAAETKIEWCDATFNPWIGCTRVSPACDDCYAARSTPARTLGVDWGPGQPRRRTAADNWAQVRRWAKTLPAKLGRRPRVFCASLADVFDNEVPPAWRADLFQLIEDTPELDWLLLTKRIGNVHKMMVDVAASLFWMDWLDQCHLPPNVWLGATVVNQAEADRDIPKLLATPARVRFLSIEPMLGPIDLLATGDVLCRCGGCLSMARADPEVAGLQRIDWVICGGESGPQARPMHPDWARVLRDQCEAAGAPFLFKQWGEWVDSNQRTEHKSIRYHRWPDGSTSDWLGKRSTGRLLDGREHNGFPEVQS